MNRNPWRTRARWLALIDAAAGVATALSAVAVAAGVAGDVDGWTSVVAVGVAAAVDLVAVMASVGLVTDGEAQTTPVDSPLGRDGVPLVSARMVEDLQSAIVDNDIDRARNALGLS